STEVREIEIGKYALLNALKAELRSSHTVTTFSNPDDLAAKVSSDLHSWLFDQYLAPLLDKVAQGDLPREEVQDLLAGIKDLSALNQDLLERLQEDGD